MEFKTDRWNYFDLGYTSKVMCVSLILKYKEHIYNTW